MGYTENIVLGIWTGYDTPSRIRNTSSAIRIWKAIMTSYLKDKEKKDYNFNSGVVSRTYCKSTGKLAGAGCSETATGYYITSKWW